MPRILSYRILLWLIAGALLVVLFACAPKSNDGGTPERAAAAAHPAYSREHPMRLVLGGSEARDSAAVVTEFFIDQATRAVLDSIPEAHYITINYRDSLVQDFIARGEKGVPRAELGRRLDAAGVIYTRVARFGNVLAIETRIIDPTNDRLLFRDLCFDVVRYRDSTGTMLLGPTLYDIMRKSLSRYFGVEHRPDQPVITEPLVVTSVAIPADSTLGQVRMYRQQYATKAVKAFGELARLNFPELMAFDYQSRDALYGLVGISAVNDCVPIARLERQIMFDVGIERYVAASAAVVGDSIRLRVEIRAITSRSTDTLVDAQERGYARTAFESTKSEDDFVIGLIDQAEPLFEREAQRLRNAYASERAHHN